MSLLRRASAWLVGLAMLSAVAPVFAQTSVTNTATITLPTGMTCPAPGPGGVCSWTSSVNTPVTSPVLTLVKSASAPSFTVGAPASYTLQVTNSGNAATPLPATVVDTIPAGLTIGTLPTGCTAAGQTVTCTIAAGLSHEAPANVVSFTVPVTPTAVAPAPGLVNSASVSGGGDAGCPAAARCTSSVSTPVGNVALTKTLTGETGVLAGVAEAGETLTYTITLTNSGGTAISYNLTDTLGAGLTFASASHGGSNAGQTTSWTGLSVPANGTLVVTVTATVNAPVAVTAVSNLARATGDPEPACPSTGCVVTPTTAKVALVKTLTGESGALAGVAEAGETLTYTITLTNHGGAPANDYALVDDLGPGLTFVSATAGGTNAGQTTTWAGLTIPANGSLAVQLVATVNSPVGVASVQNLAREQGDPEAVCPGPGCVQIPTAAWVTPQKVLASEAGGREAGLAEFGETLHYTITLTNRGGTAFTNYRLTEHVPAGATLTAVTGATGFTGPVQGPAAVALTVPAVPASGVASVVVSFRIADAAPAGQVEIVNRIDGGDIDPACAAACRVTTPLQQASGQLSIVKSTAVTEARVGDLVRYTVRVVNVGQTDQVDGTVVDTPPRGFHYVPGSMTVVDRDNAFRLGAAQSPLNIGGIDVAAGEEAVITYVLRVGAGVRHGVHANQARALDRDGLPVSNVGTAQVTVVADPLFDESLIMGTVFDDRDGDGWQDPASLTHVAVKGGFAPSAYVAGSTTIDRGQGPQPVPDASAPLLHGLSLGRIAGRESAADAPENHQVVIRQRLRTPSFTDDFTLTSSEGVILRMNAAGQTRLERQGDAGKGLNGALPGVTRTVAQTEGGYVVEYTVRNLGIDERGIPGVRIASVEGLLIETDPWGRYHVPGIAGGHWAHGRNFLLKVDPSTLPDGAVFTTDNPLLRRVTPGVPVRFDFGVRLPVVQLAGARAQTDVVLGEVLFEPGKAELAEAHAATVARIAAKVDEFGGQGELVIAANGESRDLALARVAALRDAVLPRLQPASARVLRVVARTETSDPGTLLVGRSSVATVLGTVLFDTDRAEVKPQFIPLLRQLAKQLEAEGGGPVQIVGHADHRGSVRYNEALGMRRARAVYEALAKELSPDARARVRVEVPGPAGGPVPAAVRSEPAATRKGR